MGKKFTHNQSGLPNITPEAFIKHGFQEFIGKSKAYSIGKAPLFRDMSKHMTPSPGEVYNFSFSTMWPATPYTIALMQRCR